MVAVAEAGEAGQRPVVELLAIAERLDLVIGDLPLRGREAGAVAHAVIDHGIDLAGRHRIERAVRPGPDVSSTLLATESISPRSDFQSISVRPRRSAAISASAVARSTSFSSVALSNSALVLRTSRTTDDCLAMLDNGLADALGHIGAAGNGDAMLLALAADDVDQVVIAEHVGEFEQRLGDLDVVIGELDHHRARRPLQRRQQLGDMRPRLDLDQFGQLAQHFVILGDLLVVAPVRHIAEELRHVAEQLLALGVVVVAIQHAKARKRPLPFIKFAHSSYSRLLPQT